MKQFFCLRRRVRPYRPAFLLLVVSLSYSVLPAPLGVQSLVQAQTLLQVDNVFAAGTFEDLDAAGQPRHWHSLDLKTSRIMEEAGNHFLRLRNEQDGTTQAAFCDLPVDATWKTVELRVRLRLATLDGHADGHQATARLNCIFIKADGQQAGVQSADLVPNLAKSKPWDTYTARIAVPRNTVALRLQPELTNRGQADFDDIQVLPNTLHFAGIPLRDGMMLQNFETLEARGNPAGWDLTDARRMKILDEDGNHFLRLRNDKAKDSVEVDAIVRLDPTWKRVRLTARLRGSSLQIGPERTDNARLATVFLDAALNRVGPWPPGFELVKDTDWVDETVEINIPDNAAFIILAPQMLHTVGEIDYDDIKLTRADPLDPLPIRPGLPEGQFEQLNDQGQPIGWHLEGSPRTTIAVENGNRFLRLTRDDGPDIHVEGAFQLDPAWKRIKIRVRMRAHNLKSTGGWSVAELAYDFLNATGDKVGPWPPMPALKGDSNWQTIEVETAVPDGARSLILKPEMVNMSGTLDFDDVQVEGQ